MSMTIISKSRRKNKSTGKSIRRGTYVSIPAEATKLVREGWEDLDKGVDQIRDSVVLAFVALLEAPLQIMQASIEASK